MWLRVLIRGGDWRTIEHGADEGLGVLVHLLLAAAGAKHAVVLELLAHAAARVVQRQLSILPNFCAACTGSACSVLSVFSCSCGY